jgi:serine/threonine-protein kinase
VGGAGFLVLVFVVAFFVTMSLELRSSEVAVPDFRGMSVDQTRERANALGLVVLVVEERHDPAVASGRVLEQTPRAGASVRRGRKVKLILSLGGELLQVPDLVGRALRTVQIELQRDGFVPGSEARVPSSQTPAGTILAQVPSPATPAVARARVHYLVSEGPRARAWVMPDLTGLTRAEAERWVETSGFRVGAVRTVPGRPAPAGLVVGQMPLSGYPIRTKDMVDLAVAE